MQGLPLDVSANVVLDGSGNGVVPLGPSFVREHWQPVSATTSVASQVKQATCAIYRGTTLQASQQISFTLVGSNAQACGLGGVDMPSGYKIFAQWTGGDAGALATLHVIGTRSVGAPA